MRRRSVQVPVAQVTHHISPYEHYTSPNPPLPRGTTTSISMNPSTDITAYIYSNDTWTETLVFIGCTIYYLYFHVGDPSCAFAHQFEFVLFATGTSAVDGA